MEDANSFAYLIGIMASSFPQINKVGTMIFESLSVMGGAFFSASIVDMNAIFAFGWVIPLIKFSMAY